MICRFLFQKNKRNFVLSILVMFGFFSTISWAIVPKFELIYSFGQEQTHDSSLVHDANGNHYGIASKGGKLGFGTIYKIDQTGKYQEIYTFNGTNGTVFPKLLLNNGKLYGWTYNPNRSNLTSNAVIYPVIYRIDLSRTPATFKVLYKDKVNIGMTDLILGRNGKFYGSTSWDFNTFKSSIFQLDLSQTSPVYKRLYMLTSGYGAGFANLIEGQNGLIYGVARIDERQPPFFRQEIFRLNVNGSSPKYTNLGEFRSTEFKEVNVNVTFGNGKLYVVKNSNIHEPYVERGFKVDLYQLDPSSQTPSFLPLITLKDHWEGEVFQDNTGKLYLATNKAVFELDVSASPMNKLVFQASQLGLTDFLPGITKAPNAKFYVSSSSVDKSSILQIDVNRSHKTYKIFHTFSYLIKGKQPTDELFSISNGKIIGTTYQGGKYNEGALFQLDVSGNLPKITELRQFGGPTDKFPRPDVLIKGSNSRIYGASSQGGANNFGMLFRLVATSITPYYSILHSLTEGGGIDSLVQAANGRLYGIFKGRFTEPHQYGAIFQLNTASAPAAYQFLHSFTAADSILTGNIGLGFDGNIYSKAGFGDINFKLDLSTKPAPAYSTLSAPNLVLDLTKGSDGKYYGVSQTGGRNNTGMIFQIDNSSGIPKTNILHSFNNISGRIPDSTLIEGSPGKFYGTIKSAFLNTTDYGIAYELDTSGNNPIYRVIHKFSKYDGATPGSLIKAIDGKLYGVTAYEGKFNGGTIFRIRLNASQP